MWVESGGRSDMWVESVGLGTSGPQGGLKWA